MIKNILIAALFVALSAFAISATLKSSPEPEIPRKEEPKEYSKMVLVQSFFKDVAEAQFEKETGVKFSLPETFQFCSDNLIRADGRDFSGISCYVTSVPEGTINYFYSGRGFGIRLYFKK